MRKIFIFFFIILFQGLIFCQETRTFEIDPINAPTKKLIENFSVEKIIKLETAPDNIINYIYYLELDENKIYIANYHGCFIFSEEGTFLGKVYNIGRGPNELQLPRGLSYNMNSNQYSVYDTRSKFIAVFSGLNKLEKRIYPDLNFISDLYWLNNNKFLLYSYLPQPDSGDKNAINYCIYEYDPDTKKYRGVLRMPNNYNTLSIRYHTTFSEYNGKYYAIKVFDNTVYEYNASGLMRPGYYFDFGKYNASEELLKGKLIDGRALIGKIKKGKFCVLIDFQELEGHYIVIYDKHPNRYTTIISKGNGSQVRHSFRNENDVLSRATPFFEHDGYMIASLQPSSFLKKYKMIDKSTLSDYEKKIYAEIADGLDESDNPVLLFLKPR